MQLPGYVVRFSLALMFLLALVARFDAGGGEETPYYYGTSAMQYRHMSLFADGTPLGEATHKANWPGWYVPDRYRAAGMEKAAGYVYRVARFFGANDSRRFARRFVVFCFSLTVFAMYFLVRGLWACQASGLLAAFLIAFLSPVIDATNGRSFPHEPVAALLLIVHAALALRASRNASAIRLILLVLAGAAVLAVWEPAAYYFAAATAVAAFSGAKSRRAVVVANAFVLIVATLSLPHLIALRMSGAWPTALVLALTAYTFIDHRFKRHAWALFFVVVAGALLALVLTPVRTGATDHVQGIGYVAGRIRHLTGKPESPAALSDVFRYLWSFERAPITPHAAIALFGPLIVLAGAAVSPAIHAIQAEKRKVAVAAGTALLAACAVAIDRSATVIATAAMLPGIALCARGAVSAERSRAILVAVGAFLTLVQVTFPTGGINPLFRIARRAHVVYRDPHKFTKVSLENTDRELVKYVATQTSVKDRFLGAPEMTGLLLAFTGRTSVLLPGARTKEAAMKSVRLTGLMYESENALHSACQQLQITHVLYSVDFLLDTSTYSPRYLAGITAVLPESMVYRMHFKPESMTGFALIYENEHYRIYKVTESREPIFITDHPPVYQEDAFERAGRDVDAFRRRVVELTATYGDALASRARGDREAALKKLSWCLSQAPEFTRARIALGATLGQMGRLEEARDVLLSVVAYAPDNSLALYEAAYVLAQLDEEARARELLRILFATATDNDIIELARLLESFMDQGIPVAPIRD